MSRARADEPLHPSRVPSVSDLSIPLDSFPPRLGGPPASPSTGRGTNVTSPQSVSKSPSHRRSSSESVISMGPRTSSTLSRAAVAKPGTASTEPVFDPAAIAVPRRTRRQALRPKLEKVGFVADDEEEEIVKADPMVRDRTITLARRRQSVAQIADAALAAAAESMREEAARSKSLSASLESSEYFSTDDTALQDVDMRSPLRRAWDNFRTIVIEVLDSVPVALVMLFATIWVLFINDARTLSMSKSSDSAVDAVTTIIFYVFIVEICLQCLCRDNYFLGFFFVMDLLVVFSLFPDVPSIWSKIYTSFSSTYTLNIHAARIVRFVRLVRLIHVFIVFQDFCGEDEEDIRRRLSRRAKKAKTASRFSGPNPLDNQEEEDDDDMGAPNSKVDGGVVGQRLNELTLKRVVTGVLFMAILVPLLDVTEVDDSVQYGTAVVHFNTVNMVNPSPNSSIVVSPALYEASIAWLLRNQANALYLRVNTSDIRLNLESTISSLRTSEMFQYSLSTGNVTTELWTSILPQLSTDAKSSVGMVCFLITLLCGGAVFFSKDAQELVIQPIERMVEFVRRLSNNPLAKIQNTEIDEDETDKEADSSQFETVLLENTLRKLGGLLQIGFGDAGAEIIGQNMRGDFLDPMVSGKRMQAIFAFCDIRNFTDTTECLQEKIMTYVNQVAQIVHSATHRQGGAANKNIGDAFLLVWKFPTAKKVQAKRAAKAAALQIKGTGLRGFISRVRRFLSHHEESPTDKSDESKSAASDVKSPKNKPPAVVAKVASAKILANQNRGFNTGARGRSSSMASETGGDVVAQVNNTAGRRGSNASEASAATNASRRGSTVSTSSDGTESTINSPTIASPLARVPLLADPDVPRPEQNRVAERSLIGLLQMLIEITINATLNPWRKHPAILARMPDFEIKLGFGLHMGWAVEGALGSEQKIDASYLGAHVNLSMFLEEHTKEYGVPLLMSGEVYDLLCPTVQMRCRWLDSMSVVGRDEPLDIFTFDYTLEGIALARTRTMLNAGMGLDQSALNANSKASASTVKRMASRQSSSVGADSDEEERAKRKAEKLEKWRAKRSAASSNMKIRISNGDEESDDDVIDLFAKKPSSNSIVTPKASEDESKLSSTTPGARVTKTVDTPLLSVTITPAEHAPPPRGPKPLAVVTESDGNESASVNLVTSPGAPSSSLSNPFDSAPDPESAITQFLAENSLISAPASASASAPIGAPVSTYRPMQPGAQFPTLPTPRLPMASGAEKRSFYILESLKGGETDDLAPLQTGLDPNFVPTFNQGTKAYVGGRWEESRAYLELALQYKPNDKAAQNLLEFMGAHHFKAPSKWRGYREEGGGGH